MNILILLVPAALLLGGLALLGFFWALRHGQFEDPKGHAARILSDRYDDHPADEDLLPDAPARDRSRNPLDAPRGAP